MVRYARGYAGQQDWIGFHDDMFPQDTDNGKDWSFLAGLRKTQRTDNWKVAVIGGEMVPGKANQWLGKDFETTMGITERMLKRPITTSCAKTTPANGAENDAEIAPATPQARIVLRRSSSK